MFILKLLGLISTKKKERASPVSKALPINKRVEPSLTVSSEAPKTKKLPSFKVKQIEAIQQKQVTLQEKPAVFVKQKAEGLKIEEPHGLDNGFVADRIKYFLTKTEPKGASAKRIKAYVVSCLEGEGLSAFLASGDYIKKTIKNMKEDGLIKKDRKQDIWVYQHQANLLKRLTKKEQSYFKYLNLGLGWSRLGKDPMGAIQWIYETYDSDEFEKFCCVILAHNNVEEVRVSEKRASGADGGIDGLGKYAIDGQIVDIAIQAKRYRPDRQVQTQERQSFVGALDDLGLQYGIFITTGVFSERTKASNEMGIGTKTIQLLDQDDIIRCMLYKANSPHGYGLHKTDIGMYYLNPSMLKRAMKKY